MESRIDYNKVDPGAAKAMYGLEAYVKKSGLDSSLIELVKLRCFRHDVLLSRQMSGDS
ncbi:MAG: hypothetical protein ACREEM_17190 [Blastocatellia bacterium]